MSESPLSEAENAIPGVTPPWIHLSMDHLSSFYVLRERIAFKGDDSLGGYAAVSRALLHRDVVAPENSVLIRRCEDCGGAGCSEVAIKKLRSDAELAGERLERRLARELLVMSDLEHQNIVKLQGFYLCTSHGEAWIISSWVSGGDARAYVKSRHPTVAGKLRLISDAGEGLKYLHSQQISICHGDVKGKNLLVDLSDGRGKLCDFGLASTGDSALIDHLATEARPSGTTAWCSPEALDGMTPTPLDDIWSFGSLAYEIMLDQLPFHQHGSAIGKVVKNITTYNYPIIPTRPVSGPSTVSKLTVPGPVRLMILECWKRVPNERIPISDAVEKLEETILHCNVDGNFEESSSPSCDNPPAQEVFASSQLVEGLPGSRQPSSSLIPNKPGFLPSMSRLLNGCICVPCVSSFRQRGPRRQGSESTEEPAIVSQDADPTQGAVVASPLFEPLELQNTEIVLNMEENTYGRSNGLLRAIDISSGEKVAVKVLHDVKDAFDNLDGLGDHGITRKKSINDSLLSHIRLMTSLCLRTENPLKCINPVLGYSVIDGLVSPVTRWCNKGNIQDYLKRHRRADRWAIVDQIAAGLESLHNEDPPIIHTALKLENVLVDEMGQICLADVGGIRLLEELTSGITTCGKLSDIRWMPRKQEDWSVKSDVYSFGLLTLAVLTNIYPYGSLTELEVARHKLAAPPDYMDGLRDSPLWKLLYPCLSLDPERRPSLSYLREELARLSVDLSADVERNAHPAPLVYYGAPERPSTIRSVSEPANWEQTSPVTYHDDAESGSWVSSEAEDIVLKPAEPTPSVPRLKEFHLDRHELDLILEPLAPFFIPLSTLHIERSPGDARGGYGVVRVGKLQPTDGSQPKKVAVKELMSDLSRTIPLRVVYGIAREMIVWSKLDHPNVLPFTGYHLSDDMNIAYLVCPYMDEGNIKNYLLQYNPDYTARAYLVQDTVNGLKYLHSINICHGDLKSFNVLVTSKKRAMLCDFGLACVMQDQPTGLTTSTDFKGSFRWCSPELIENHPRNFLSDMWAWACLALEIVTGDFPYNDVPLDAAVINWIIKKSTPASATKSCKVLPKGMLGLWDLCWSSDPSTRPDAATCASAWSMCWNKVDWHSDFLESGSIESDAIPAYYPTQGTAPQSLGQSEELQFDRHKLDLALKPLTPFFIPLSNLHIERTLDDAGGLYAVVRVGRLSSDGSPPKKVAVKELKSDLSRAIPLRMAYRIAREMIVWSKLDHPNVLPFTGYHLSDDMNIAYLVCPYMDEGNIKNYLLQYNPDYTARAYLVQDTVNGLKYLHSINVCHGDLKSFNVLVTSQKRAMLCDFGHAYVIHDQPTGLTTSTGFKGSFRWCSPELIENNSRNFLSDMWAWACLALEIVTGDLPYNDVPLDAAVINWIIKGSTPARWTKSCNILPKGMLGLWDLCWSFDPSTRPDVVTCADAWSVCWNKVEWHSSFLEGTSVQSASVDIIPSARPAQPLAALQQPPLGKYAHVWQGGAVSNHGFPSKSTTPKPHPQSTRAPASSPIPVHGGRESPAPQTAPFGGEAQDFPHYDENTLRRVVSLNRGTPMASVAMSTDGHGSRTLLAASDAGEGSSLDTMKKMTRLIMRAAELNDRALWIEVCGRGATPRGAKDIGSNIKSWLKHGTEPIRLTAVRTWVLALKENFHPFLSLTSGRDFLKMIQGHHDNPQTPSSVKRRLYDAVAGAAWEFGSSYPDFRWCWTMIKGYGPPSEGIPFDLRDPFFSLPPAPAPREPITPPRRSYQPPQPVDPRWSTTVSPNQSYIGSPPLSTSPPGTHGGPSDWDHSPVSRVSSSPVPIENHQPTPVGSSDRPSVDGHQSRPYMTAEQYGQQSVHRTATTRAVPPGPRVNQGHHRNQSAPVVQMKDKLSISVDFGATMSGVAYASSRIDSGRVHSIVHWPGSRQTFRKIPTCLQYGYGGRVWAWGLEAKMNGPVRNVMTCEWFKLFLEPRTLRDPGTVDPRLPRLPPNKSPKDLIVDYLTHLFNYAKQRITIETNLVVGDLDSAEVWLTVPASWDQMGCDIMREAAMAAGLVKSAHAADCEWRERLHIVPEPEAAAVHCVALTDLHILRASETFMICDAGGGMVDLATYTIIGDPSNLEIAEVCANSGANSGSIFLDLRFRELVRTLLADHPVHLDPASLAFFMHAFARSEKLDFQGDADDDKFFHFNCLSVEDSNDPSIGLINGELSIPGNLLRQQVFDPIIDEVIVQLEDQMRRGNRPIDALLLVGGFSENSYLFKRVFERFRHRIRVIARPDDADTATNRGAARYGLAVKSPVSSVVAPRAYLMIAKLPAEKEDERARPAYISTNAAGAPVCEKRVEYLVHKGAILRKGQRLICKFCKYSSSALDDKFEATLYTSESDTIMRYTDEGPISELCKWSVDLAKLPLFQKHSRQHRGGFFTEFELGLELDSTEVRGVLLQDGKEVSRVVFDFFQ